MTEEKWSKEMKKDKILIITGKEKGEKLKGGRNLFSEEK